MLPLVTLSGPLRPPSLGGAPKHLVILLHGWGADGANLIDLAGAMAPAMPHAQFIAPNAPFSCETGSGYQWFSLYDRAPSQLLQGARAAALILGHFIEEQLEALKLTEDKLALVGFSQGTMMALHAALRRETPCAGVVGFSGAMVGGELLPQELKSKPPVCLIHGEWDEVVPFGAMAHAETALRAAGVSVETHTRQGLGHSIDMEGLKIATEFLKKRLV